ncbi:S24 family peptidase [Pseudomonas taiwanensis]|uniref:S24 family peptidase n=1 Tax=Pseudomonas taiwanensis TaxID=470150 RepID=UPI0028DEB00C|nr:S24 family peptidase [Pseudomonas taiwanensis]MDT8924645.1 S24 family peptidase [Pseudomonas taiwanensis]
MKNIPEHQIEESKKLRAIFEERQLQAKLRGKRITQAGVGRACGWASAQSVFSQLLVGRMALSLDSLLKLALVLRFVPSEVSPRLASTMELIAKLPGIVQTDVEPYRLPVLAGSVPVSCKALLSDGKVFELERGAFGHLTIYSVDPAAYGMVVSGNHLSPRFRNGEVLVIEPGKPYQAGDEVLVQLDDGLCMLKEFIYQRDGQCRLDGVCGGDSVYVEDTSIQAMHVVDAIAKPSRWNR